MKRGLVISGGGFLGAFGLGLTEYLQKIKGINWDVYAGTSAGSLVTTGIASNFEDFKKMYLNIEYDDVFKDSTFVFNKLNIFSVIWRTIFGYSSISDSSKLRELLSTVVTEENYKQKKIISCVTNYNTGKAEFHNNLDTEYEKFLDYVWASTSIPIMFKPVKIDHQYYYDGGVTNNIPIQSLLDEGCDEIDVIILKHKNNEEKDWKPKNLLKVVGKTVSVLLDNQVQQNVLMSQLELKKNVKLNFYYTPPYLNDKNVLDVELVEEWWKIGYNYLRDNKKVSFTLKK